MRQHALLLDMPGETARDKTNVYGVLQIVKLSNRLFIVAVISIVLMIGTVAQVGAQDASFVYSDSTVKLTFYPDGGVNIENLTNVSIGVNDMELAGYTSISNYRFNAEEVKASCPSGGGVVFYFNIRPNWGTMDSYRARVSFRSLCSSIFAGQSGSENGNNSGGNTIPQPTLPPVTSLGSQTPDSTVCQVTPSGNRVNVRRGAGTDYGIVGQLAHGYYLTVESLTDNGWYKVKDASQYVSSTVVTASGPNCQTGNQERGNPTATPSGTDTGSSSARPDDDNFCIVTMPFNGYVTVMDPWGVKLPTEYHPEDEIFLIITNSDVDYSVTFTENGEDYTIVVDGETCTAS